MVYRPVILEKGGAEALDKSCNDNEIIHFMQNIYYRKSYHLRDTYVKYDSVGRNLHHPTQCGSYEDLICMPDNLRPKYVAS